MTESIQNPGLYRKLSEPFDSIEAANKALSEFADELRILREKYHLPDLYWISRITFRSADVDEICAYSHAGAGNVLEWEAMLAYALGVEQADRQKRIGELMAGAITRKRSQ